MEVILVYVSVGEDFDQVQHIATVRVLLIRVRQDCNEEVQQQDIVDEQEGDEERHPCCVPEGASVEDLEVELAERVLKEGQERVVEAAELRDIVEENDTDTCESRKLEGEEDKERHDLLDHSHDDFDQRA